MTFQQLYETVYRQMRDTGQTRYDLAFVKRYLNDAERQFCRKTEYSIKKDASITTASGTREYTLPSDFLHEVAVFWNGRRMAWTDLEDTIHEDGDQSGEPTAYYIEGGKIGFEDVPTSAQTVTIVYYSIGGAMAQTSDTPIVPTEHHMLLVAYACYWCSIEGDDDRMSKFYEAWLRGVQEASEDIVKKSPWPEVGGHRVEVERTTHDVLGILD